MTVIIRGKQAFKALFVLLFSSSRLYDGIVLSLFLTDLARSGLLSFLVYG
jgi:hypothetical protein